jgi:hypothetical protein
MLSFLGLKSEQNSLKDWLRFSLKKPKMRFSINLLNIEREKEKLGMRRRNNNIF